MMDSLEDDNQDLKPTCKEPSFDALAASSLGRSRREVASLRRAGRARCKESVCHGFGVVFVVVGILFQLLFLVLFIAAFNNTSFL